MPKIGDVRDDGKVFMCKNPRCNGGEYWVSMERFLAKKGHDYYEKKELTKARKLHRATCGEKWREKLAIARVGREDRKRQYARDYQRKLREADPERQARLHHESYLRCKDSEDFKQRRREANMRHHYKKNAAKILARAEKDRLRAEEKERKVAERELKMRLAAENKAAAALAKSLRPPRVVLTDEQRKERRREDKRNYKHRRRAILRGQEAKATPAQLRKAKDKCKGICHYCGTKHKNLTLDHVIPLAKGGGHTLDNIVFACHMCNSSKRDLPAHEFGRQFGMLIV